MHTQTISERATGASGGERRGKPRSYDQHKRFFAVISAVHSHWPEAHPFQPDSAEHLRAWLLVRARHCTIQTFHMSEQADEFARLVPIITATMMRKHCWAKAVGSELHVCVPNSIDYTTVGHLEFQSINDAVDEIIRAETDLDPKQLLRQTT